jgi:hypothetical protein
MTICLAQWREFMSNPAHGGEWPHFGRLVAQRASPEKKDVKNYVRSHYVYENKQNGEILTTKNSDILAQFGRM